MDSRSDKIIRKHKNGRKNQLCSVCLDKRCPDSKSTHAKRNHGQKPKYKNKR